MYLLNDKSTCFDSKVPCHVSKMAKRMEVQLKSHILEPMNQISILRFLPAFQTACDANGVHEGAAMWLFHYIDKKTTKAALSARTTTKVDKRKYKGGQLAPYPKVVNYLLKTYATDEVIAETDTGINQFRQGDLISPPEYAQEWWTKALKCGTVYTEPKLTGLFIEGLHGSITQSVRNYWGNNGKGDFQELARH